MITRGANRIVFLIGGYAFKFPTVITWRDFLFGLLNNQTESRLGRVGHPRLCPVVFFIPGGFLTVMKRVKVLTEDEMKLVMIKDFNGTCIEFKPDSFGWLDGRIVAIDYGWEK